MTKPKLIVGTVNSQPLGMDHEQFEELYQHSYKPFLKLLNSNPDVNAVLYYSGILLESLEEHHPEFIMLLHDLVRRKQVELVGGAYYEPFLPLIPNSDKLGQIEFLTTYLRKRFGTRVRGCWVPFGVWDHILPFTLKNSGMDYAFLNAGAFKDGDGSLIPSITEEYGKSLIVYPVFSNFVHDLPDKDPAAVLDELLAVLSDTPGALVSLVFDGNRLFNHNHDPVEREEWITGFFKTVRENRKKIEYVLPGKYSRTPRPVRKKYYPPTSYGELMEWRGDRHAEDHAVFKKSLLKYPESNILYAKMMYVYQLVNQIRGDRSRKKTAREELWKGQGNSSFWHARDGGLFRNAYRKASFSALLEAEKLTRERGIFKSSVVVTDIDLDGFDEYLYQGNALNAYITRRGGQVFELDYLPGSWNYLDTLSHEKNGHSPYLRRAFMDHLLPSGMSMEQFELFDFQEQNSNLYNDYRVDEIDREKMRIDFSVDGTLPDTGAVFQIAKQFDLKRNTLSVHYTLESGDILEKSPVFAPEIHLALPEPPGEKVRAFALVKGERKPLLEEKTTLRQVQELVIEDTVNRACITLSAGKRFRLWMFQVYTPYITEEGEQREYQSTCIVPAWNKVLGANKPWETALHLKIEKLVKSK